ncbi:IS701 family transposase [Streptomyces parvulus]|uniref:IS701 family transposase n=1 Tax=Streptomyces parvulus TaxID=146923 RepID=UPI00368F6484
MFDQLTGRIAGRFARVEPRRRATALVLGLLPDLPRKNCWTLAEQAGDATPDGMQHLLHRAKWDADAVRDDLRAYVVEHLADDGAVLVVDETGDLKKAPPRSVSSASTPARRAGSRTPRSPSTSSTPPTGHAAIDRALYVPRSRTDAPDRCRAAGIPDDLAFATKPVLAARMIGRALDTGTPARWVAGDEVYGDNPHLRADLEERRTHYVLAVSSTHQVIMAAGKFPAKAIAAKIPKRAWQRRSAGEGAKGERYYDWAQADIHGPADRLGHWWLLARRNRRTGELAFYRCFSPHPVPLSDLIRVAGRRWTIEETFHAGKGLAGLDEHQVRRWVTLATPPPGPRPRLPLPAASGHPLMEITIYGWSTKWTIKAH